MTHDQHHHGHEQHHHEPKRGRALHKDWRAWIVVLLMLAAMAIYVASLDESIQPGGNVGPPVPADAAP